MAELDDIAKLIADRFDGLSPQLKRAAHWVLEHPDDVALRSMREVAQAAGLPVVTFLRLSRALGHEDYGTLRGLFQDRLRAGTVPDDRFAFKARRLQEMGGDRGVQDLVKRLFGAELDTIEATYAKNHPDTLIEAAELLEGAERIFVLGQRSCFSVAYIFNYVHRLFRPNSILVQAVGGLMVDEMRGIGPSDALLVISMAPYTAEAVEITRYVRARGAKILALTDDRLSPVARAADRSLLVAGSTPSFFHSIVPLVTLAQTLLAVLVARGGEGALAAIEASERELDHFQAYWPDEQNPDEQNDEQNGEMP